MISHKCVDENDDNLNDDLSWNLWTQLSFKSQRQTYHIENPPWIQSKYEEYSESDSMPSQEQPMDKSDLHSYLQEDVSNCQDQYL